MFLSKVSLVLVVAILGTSWFSGDGLVSAQPLPMPQYYPGQQPMPQYYPGQQPMPQYYPGQQPMPQYYPMQQPMPQYYPVQQPKPQPGVDAPIAPLTGVIDAGSDFVRNLAGAITGGTAPPPRKYY